MGKFRRIGLHGRGNVHSGRPPTFYLEYKGGRREELTLEDWIVVELPVFYQFDQEVLLGFVLDFVEEACTEILDIGFEFEKSFLELVEPSLHTGVPMVFDGVVRPAG